jgi:chitin-binding protein
VTLHWNASTDNVAVVGYRIFRNDQYVRTTTYLTRRLWQPAGVYTFYVRAVDAAGNVSRRSNRITVTVLGT